MPEYRYTARVRDGREVRGLLTVGSQAVAASSLTARGLFPVQIELATSAARSLSTARVGPRYVALFYAQLADLLKSGVPLLRSLEILERQTSHARLRAVIGDVREQVADGSPLAEALHRHPRTFGELAVSMVRAGEEGSFLEEVLKRIAAFSEHQQDLKGRVVGALAYPLFLLAMGTIVVTIMIVWFVPKFAPIFERLEERGRLPWATTTLLAISDLLGGWWHVLSVLAVVAVIGLFRFVHTARGRLWFDRLKIANPTLFVIPGSGVRVRLGLGQIVRSLAIARFSRILGTLLRNGVPILPSLRIAKDATGNRVLAEAIGTAADRVTEGRALAGPLSASGEFPIEVVEMISVGEEANNLEQVLIDIADGLERRTYRQLELFVRLLEPVMLLVMAGLILFVALGLLLPVLQSSGAL